MSKSDGQVNKGLADNQTRKQLRYTYTMEERNAKATELVTALNRVDAVNDELDRIKQDYKARLASLESEAALLRSAVLSGYEMREYLCAWTYDDPRRGRKTLRKVEGGDIVSEEDMTEADRQMVLDIIMSSTPAAAAPAVNAEAIDIYVSAHSVLLEDLLAVKHEPTERWFIDCAIMWFERSPQSELAVPLPEVAERMKAFCNDTPESELDKIAQFIRLKSLADVAHWDAALSAIDAHLAQVRDARRIKAEAKKEARKGRRAASAGTVDLPADEGTRDDAGEDSKNNM